MFNDFNGIQWDCQNKRLSRACFFLYGTVYENLPVAIQKKACSGIRLLFRPILNINYDKSDKLSDM